VQFAFSEQKLLLKVSEFPLQQITVLKFHWQDAQNLWRVEWLCPPRSQHCSSVGVSISVRSESFLLPLCFRECDNTNDFGWGRMKVDVSPRYRSISGADANVQLSESSGSVLGLKWEMDFFYNNMDYDEVRLTLMSENPNWRP
jgi:hypothetical protein